MKRLIVMIMVVVGLAACGGSTTPFQNLRWDPVTTYCDGVQVTTSVQYQVYAVPGDNVIPTKIVNGPCGPVHVPDGSPVLVSNRPSVRWTRKGRWTIGVQAVVDSAPSGLSQTITVGK